MIVLPSSHLLEKAARSALARPKLPPCYTAPMATTEIQELSEFIHDHMATKEDLADLATKDDVRAIVSNALDESLKPINLELSAIRRDLDALSQKVENMTGYRKEIDHALERIAAIEKHLGISKKIAA